MTYNKPKGITYVDMCKYFDAHIYSDDRDDNTLYQYLYHIVYMLACKKRYFASWAEYDAFALYMSSKVYLRYINPSHQGQDDRIKSVLNYCKNLLYPTKVDFQKETYAEIFGPTPKMDADFSGMRQDMEDRVQASHIDAGMLLDDLVAEFSGLSKVIRSEVAKTPYALDPIISRRLFMSVLLTMVNGMTLSNPACSKLAKRQKGRPDYDAAVLDALRRERDAAPTLWRLDKSFADTVHILTIKVRRKCGEKIHMVRRGFELSDDDVAAVLASAYGNVLRDDNEEI